MGAAVRAGVELFALTDHDTVRGVDEALAAAAGTDLTLVPAIELSIVDRAAPDIHLLGYGIDHNDSVLLAALDRFRTDRLKRADRMIDALREAGFAIDTAGIKRRRSTGLPVGRPHVAEAVLAHTANRARLTDERIATVSHLIRRYLIEGTPGFVTRTTPNAAEAIALIHSAGGVAVWAHPFWDVSDPDAAIETLARYQAVGLDGVEVFYVTHDEAQTRLLYDAAVRHGMLRTGSSDFHGPAHPLFGRIGAFELYDLQPKLGPLVEPYAGDVPNRARQL